MFESTRDVIIRSERWTEAVRFYESVLGLPAASRGEGIVGFETGAFRLYVERGPDHGPVFEYRVSNLAQARDRLLAAGCTLVEEDPRVPRCYLRDPHGITFNVHESRPGESSA